MVTMYLKNKYEVSLRELVRVATEKGGIPAKITVDLKEAMGIIQELNLTDEHCHTVRKNGFNIVIPTTSGDSSTNNVCSFETFRGLGMGELISRWEEDKLSVTFDGIPLKIVNK